MNMSSRTLNAQALAMIDAISRERRKTQWSMEPDSRYYRLARIASKASDRYHRRVRRDHLTYEECLTKYPRLSRILQYCLIGSRGETGCCIRDYRDGYDFSCECVSHSGLTPEYWIKQAFRCRHSVRAILQAHN